MTHSLSDVGLIWAFVTVHCTICRLPNATKMATLSLTQAMNEKYDVRREMNEKLIQIKCSDTQRRVEVTMCVLLLVVGVLYLLS